MSIVNNTDPLPSRLRIAIINARADAHRCIGLGDEASRSGRRALRATTADIDRLDGAISGHNTKPTIPCATGKCSQCDTLRQLTAVYLPESSPE